MSQRTTIVRAVDTLNVREWTFLYFENRHMFVLDSYYVKARPTKRHGYKTTSLYERQPYNDGRNYGVPRLNEADVPMPDDVVTELRDEFMKTLRVGRWADYQRGERP